MRHAYFKQNSYTQHKAESLIETKAAVLRFANISYDQHEYLMFEYGCRFIEKIMLSKSDQRRVLQNEDFGFWMWWRFKWAVDDEGLINTKSFLEKVSYEEMKAYMLDSPLLKNQFQTHLVHL